MVLCDNPFPDVVLVGTRPGLLLDNVHLLLVTLLNQLFAVDESSHKIWETSSARSATLEDTS